MRKIVTIACVLWSVVSLAAQGSLMTDEEEAKALAQIVNAPLRSASTSYMESLTEYRQGTMEFTNLESRYQEIFTKLLGDVRTAIENDISGKIHLIATDKAHLKIVIGLAQHELEIPAYQCLLPPSSNVENLLINGDFSQGTDGWALSEGAATLVVNPAGTFDSTSPVANRGSLSFSDMPAKPGYASVSQEIQTTAGRTYLVSGYLIEGSLNVIGARFLTSSLTGKTTHFPQVSNEIEGEGVRRRYFWLIASGHSIQVTLTGGAQAVFKNISVVDITSEAAMEVAQKVCPPVTTTGDPELGHYPQFKHGLVVGENLLDGGVSIQKNIDPSALKNGGHPYWYIDGSIPANHGIKFVNTVSGAHAITMPPETSVTTNGPIPCPISTYKCAVDILVPEGASGQVSLEFSGTDLLKNTSLPKLSQTFYSLIPGKRNTVMLHIGDDMFAEMAEGTFFRPIVTITNLGDALTIANATLTPYLVNAWDLINSVNPYAPNRSWYQELGTRQFYNFTKGPISNDWAVALTGNTMLTPGMPASDYTMQTADGIKLISICKQTVANGGIQSTQVIPSGRSFSIAMKFTAKLDDWGYEPTFALRTYGESQGGPESLLYHTNAPGADVITEFDCEMGSDVSKNTPPPPGRLCIRDGSYIGHAFGGHSEYLDTSADGSPIWKEVPDFWDERPHILEMKGTYNSDGTFTLARIFDGTTFSTQDLGVGPFSPMYIKIALENPNWNNQGRTNGRAEVVIHSLNVSISPKEKAHPTIALEDIDYTWFTPAGGGAISYAPFPHKG